MTSDINTVRIDHCAKGGAQACNIQCRWRAIHRQLTKVTGIACRINTGKVNNIPRLAGNCLCKTAIGVYTRDNTFTDAVNRLVHKVFH